MNAPDDADAGRIIEIVTYDPQWPTLFEKERQRLAKIPGHIAIAIEHVGSTAVPGLAAKPVIDIHLVVRESADESAYRLQVEQAGYKLVVCQPDWYEHRMFKRHEPTVNLHVFSADCPEIDRCRILRDWLRQNSGDRQLYESVKRKLAARHGGMWRIMRTQRRTSSPP